MKVRDFISVLNLKNTTVIYTDTEGNYFLKDYVLDKEIVKVEDSVELYDTPGPGANVYLYVYVR